MGTTWNGNHTPGNDDMWNLVVDMRKQAILNNRVIPVFSKSERDGLVDAAPNGVIPDGTVVVRMDQASKGAIFDVFANGSWQVGDTGVLTSGISLTAAADFTLESYSLVRTGPQVTARVDLTFTGESISSSGTMGNIVPDLDVFQLESKYAPLWATYNVSWCRTGAAQYFGRIDSGGGGTITHMVSGGEIAKGTAVRFDGSWRIA